MCFPSDTRYLYASIRSVRIALCERFACLYTKCSHRPMREVRMLLYEVFASPYARGSHAYIRSVRIALCERFVCFYTKCSHRLIREVRMLLYEVFASPCARGSIRAGRTVKRLCLLKPVLRLHLSELLVFDRAFHNFFVDFLFAVFFNKSRIF